MFAQLGLVDFWQVMGCFIIIFFYPYLVFLLTYSFSHLSCLTRFLTQLTVFVHTA